MRDPRNRAHTRIEAARTLLSENRSSVSEVDIKEADKTMRRTAKELGIKNPILEIPLEVD